MKISNPSLILAVIVSAIMLPAGQILAQHDHGHGPGQHEHAEAEVVVPDTYADAIDVIRAQLDKIETLMSTGALHQVHPEAAVIRDVAKMLVRLALKPNAGVPRSAIREINLTAKDLAAMFGPIDEAGDSGDLAGTQKVYGQMIALFDVLDSHVPHKPVRASGGYSVRVQPTGQIEPGVTVSLRFKIEDAAGTVVTDLEVVHTKVLHLLMVSADLSWYAHEHPVVRGDGTLSLSFSFPRPGEYVLFHEFTPSGAGEQVVPVTLRIAGTGPPAAALVVDSQRVKEVDGYTISLDTSGPITAGQETMLSYNISRRGQPVTDLEPYLGAMGHLAVVSEDLKHFVHSHPLGTAVSFHTGFPEAGLYKAWAQFKHRGRVITVPFVLEAGHDDAGHGHGHGHGHGDDHGH